MVLAQLLVIVLAIGYLGELGRQVHLCKRLSDDVIIGTKTGAPAIALGVNQGAHCGV